MTTTAINATIQPTEDPEKVAQAVRNLFGDIELNTDAEKGLITATLTGLEALTDLRNRIAQDRIRATLIKVLTRWTKEDRLGFGFNRQAAFAGHVSLSLENEDPMGPIHVEITGDVAGVITFLCT